MTECDTKTAANAGLLYSGAARALSLAMAVVISLAVLGLPKLVVSATGHVDHGWLTLLMWGMAGGFVHGVGFVPRNRVLRVLLGPIVAWSASLLATVVFAFA
jgi:cyd operon protein YbgE